MGKTHWSAEVDQIHDQILKLLSLHERVAITQTEYKGDFFRIFRNAYERGFCGPLLYRDYVDTGCIEWISRKPRVSGGTIWTYAQDKGWIAADMSDRGDRYKKITLVMTWWDAWTYALHSIWYKTKCYRRIYKDNLAR